MAGLYIHIPFCVKKCDYCDFVSFANPSRREAYVRALINELERTDCKTDTIDTVFIGGGTPTVLPSGCIKRILDTARRSFFIAKDAEITIEGNPGTLMKDKLDEYLSAGVNRISVGVQSLDYKLLSRIGRIHTAKEALGALALVREAGFTNVNADVMYGLPGQSVEQFEDTLRGVASAGVEHISAYSLILEEGTPLFSRVEAGENLPDEDECYAMHALTIDLLDKLGYSRYEISNYAKPGRECRHNLNYWDCGDYLGFGVAAHSALHRDGALTRAYNTSDLDEYISAGGVGVMTAEREAPDEEIFDYIMLGLRKTEGISPEGFLSRFGRDVFEVYSEPVQKLRENGWLAPGDRLALNRQGLDMQNSALLLFMEN